MASTEVAVVGGGIAGCAIAWELVQDYRGYRRLPVRRSAGVLGGAVAL